MPNKSKRGRPPHPDILTPAEWKVVHAAQHGLSNAQIAKRQGVSINAIKFHIANVLAKLGVKNKRELLLWLGTPENSHATKVSTMKFEPNFSSVGQIARSVSNLAQSEAWYRDVLGLTHLYTFGALSFFQCGSTRIMLNSDGGTAEPESILYLTTSDIQQTTKALMNKGVEFSNAPHMIHRHDDGTEEWMAFFNDPDGRPLGLMASYPANSSQPE